MITFDTKHNFFFLKCDECGIELVPFSTKEVMEKNAKQIGWLKYYYAPVGSRVPPTARHYCNNPCQPDSIVSKYGERVF